MNKLCIYFVYIAEMLPFCLQLGTLGGGKHFFMQMRPKYMWNWLAWADTSNYLLPRSRMNFQAQEETLT